MKRAIQEAVKLSPIDINKKPYAFVDSAVTVGTAYILICRQHYLQKSTGTILPI